MNCPQCNGKATQRLLAPYCSTGCLTAKLEKRTDIDILKGKSTNRVEYQARDTSEKLERLELPELEELKVA